MTVTKVRPGQLWIRNTDLGIYLIIPLEDMPSNENWNSVISYWISSIDDGEHEPSASVVQGYLSMMLSETALGVATVSLLSDCPEGGGG